MEVVNGVRTIYFRKNSFPRTPARTAKGVSFKFEGEFKYHGNIEKHFYQFGDDFVALEGTLTRYVRGAESGSQKITFRYQHQLGYY